MSNPSEETGSWKTLPPDSQVTYPSRPAQEWRRTNESDNSMLAPIPLWARRFLGGVATVGLAGAIVLLLLLRLSDPATEPEFHVIGISPYNAPGLPPNAFGREDAEAFVAAYNAEYIPDQLTGEGLRLTLDNYSNSDSGKDSNLIVLLSLHGIVAMRDDDQPQALFLALDATPDSPFLSVPGTQDSTSPVIGLEEILGSLKSTPAENVLLLIDVGRLAPNWRLGHLGNDLPTQLRTEIEKLAPENLHVILSTDDGETSWTMDAARQSVFSHFVLQGLAGAADGWHTLDSNVARGDATTNHRVSCSELASYVQHHVQQWAQQNRGVTQTVSWIPARSKTPDFDLVAAGDVSPTEPDTATDESTEPDEDGSPKGTDDKAAPKSDDAAPKSKTKKTDGKKTASADVPSESKSEETTESDPTDTGSGDTPEATPTAAEIAAALGRLDELWQQRDALRQTQRAALFAPRSWRALQTRLLRSEQLIRCQSDATTELQRASDLLAAITAQVSGEPVYSKLDRSTRSSLPILKLTVSPTDRLDDTKRTAIRTFVEAAWTLPETRPAQPAAKTPTAKPAEAAKPAEKAATNAPPANDETPKIQTRQEAIAGLIAQLPETGPGRRAARIELAAQLIRQLASNTQFTEQDLEKSRPILELIGEPALPSELMSLKRLANLALRSGELGIRWDKSFATLCNAVFRLRVGLEDFAARNSDLLPRLGTDLDKALQHTTAAERWLEQGAGDHARAQFQLAETFHKALATNETLIRHAVLLRARLMIELPDLARWVAHRMEADPTRCQQAPLSQPAKELLNSRGRFANLDRSPLKEQEEKNLLRMILGARKLNQLLGVISHDAKTRTALAEVCRKLDGEYEAFQATFDRHVDELNQVPPGDITPFQWREVDLLMMVPWISTTNRSELRTRLLTIRPSTVAGDAETRQRDLAGVWQAFWAIQTLSLAVPATTASTDKKRPTEGPVELETLWTLWDEFINASAAGQERSGHPTMVARLRLGREINRAWRRIADDLDDPARTSPAQVQQQALLVRSLDGADAPNPRLDRVDSIVQVNRATTTQNLLKQREDWSLRRQPPEWLKTWLPQRIECALKTARADSSHDIRLSIPDQGLDGSWKLAFEGSGKIHPTLNGQKITAPLSVTRETIDGLRIQLDQDVGHSRKWLAIALLDKSGFPVAVERVPVIPPFDPTKWRIVFLADGESKTFRIDQQSGRNELVTTASGTPVAILRLPPSAGSPVDPMPAAAPGKAAGDKAPAPKKPDSSVLQLTPFLVRPENDDSKSVSVKVLRRTSDGKTQQFLQGEFPLKQSDRLLPLAFQSTDKKPFPQAELSHGFIFELELRGNSESKTVAYRIQPDFWHPRDFLRVGNPQFQDFRLSLELGQQFGIDSLVPRILDVELILPSELQTLARDSFLKTRVGSQGETLYVEFDESDLDRLAGPWPIGLKVNGYPRAFSWTLEHGFPAATRPAGLRVIAPQKGPIFEKGSRDKPGRLLFDINSPELDRQNRRDPWQLDTGRTIRYRFAARDPKLVSPSGLFALRYPVHKRFDLVGLSKTGAWEIRRRVDDHHIVAAGDIRFPTRPGRYSLEAVLETGDRTTFQAPPMEIGIDTARSKPRVAITGVAGRFELGPDFKVEVTADDAESGIRQLAVGFDTDKDGKLAEKEILATRQLAGTDILTTSRVTLTLPAAKIPQAVGKHELLASATNGINVSSEHANRTITFVLAKAMVVVTGKRLGLRSAKLTLQRTGGNPQEFIVGRRANAKKNRTEVMAGEYTVTDTATGKKWKITIKPRVNVAVTVDYSNPKAPQLTEPAP